MKFLKQTITAALMLCVLTASALAFEPQKNDKKDPPKKEPKVVENRDKQPPPREEKKNDNRGNENRGKKP